jgi:hypothetical protein
MNGVADNENAAELPAEGLKNKARALLRPALHR